jgi:NADH-quinone oxidoreductase subunit F
MGKNISELSGRKGLEENLFEQIGRITKESDADRSERLEKLADEFLIGKANVYGAASFYDFTREENKGKEIYVCNGSACLTAGTQNALQATIEAKCGKDKTGEMVCLGRCHENHAFHYNNRNYSGSDIQHLDAIIAGTYQTKEKYHVGATGNPILTLPFSNIEEYYRTWKQVLDSDKDNLLAEIRESNVRGRGGAGFPMAFKLESCKNTPGDTKFIVCNADEGDPGAFSDRYLLEERPHSVLMGMMIAGYIMGASWGVLYIRGEYPEAVEICETEIQKLHQAGYIGKNIMGSGFDFEFKVIKAQGAYICGEETALLSSIEGQRPEVRVRPPYPTQHGLFNKPTVVNNVETLACLPWIIDNGGKAFAAIGRGKSTGTKLISLDGHFNRPGLYEADMGTPLRTVIDELGQGFRVPVKAMHIGGPLGGLVPVCKIDELTLDFESFNQGGFLLGHASVVCIPEHFPLAKYIEHLFEFTAHESCGKCFPCRLGSTRGKEMFQKALNENYKIDRTLLNDLLDTLETGSLCALGGGLPLPVKNALQYFEEELSLYLKS